MIQISTITEPIPSEDWVGKDREILCPICNYNQHGVQSDLCPECGMRVDPLIVWSEHYRDSVGSTRRLCTMGIIAWCIIGVVVWFIGMVTIALRQTYGSVLPTPVDLVGAWLRPMIVLAPIALLFGWRRTAKVRIYTATISGNRSMPRVLYRVLGLSIPAILIATIFVVLLLSAITS